jgi:hypothetical protein
MERHTICRNRKTQHRYPFPQTACWTHSYLNSNNVFYVYTYIHTYTYIYIYVCVCVYIYMWKFILKFVLKGNGVRTSQFWTWVNKWKESI